MPQAKTVSGPASPRVESINGLRAVCILLVLVGHLRGTAGLPTSVDSSIVAVWGVIRASRYAVHAFFVLSGFFITKLLISEQRKTGSISLWRFYLRRALRFFPGLTILLCLMGALAAADWASLSNSEIVHSVTFTMNYDSGRGWALGHLWSLSVQEQFYFLWPLLLLFAGTRRSMRVAFWIVLVVPVVRLLILTGVVPAGPGLMGETFQTVADAMATGALLAAVHAGAWTHPWLEAVRRYWWSWLAVLALAVVAHHWYRPGEVLGKSLVNVSMALLIDALLRDTMPRVSRLLTVRPLPQIGVMSYSIYLWQQLFLDRYSSAPIARAPINLALVAIVSTAAYFAVEKPITEARPAIERWLTSRRRAGRSTGVTGRAVA